MWVYSLVVFGLGWMLSTVLTWLVREISVSRGWVSAPDSNRHIHKTPIPRLGGVAIFSSFLIVAFVGAFVPRWVGLYPQAPSKAIFVLLVPAIMIFLLGVYDDLRGANAYLKFSIQTIAAVFLYIAGYGVDHFDLVSRAHTLGVALGLPLTIFWVLLVTNAFNLIDGLDGLAAGSALFSTAIVFMTTLFLPNQLVAFVSIAIAGTILGFLRFNFHPASIFLGDSGSLFIGFMLAALALVGSQKAPTIVAVSIPVVALGLPILDVAMAIVRRFVAGKSLFDADRHHIHHKLLKRGLSQRDTALILYGVTAAFGFLSLVLLHDRRTIALVLAIIAFGVFLGVYELRYQELSVLASVLRRLRHRRQRLANHVAVRNAIDQLKTSEDFRSICEVLREALQPIGFDSVCFRGVSQNGFPTSAFFPLIRGSEDCLELAWSSGHVSGPLWELRLELGGSTGKNCGWVSLSRMADSNDLPLDINALDSDFRIALADAVIRAYARLEFQELSKGDEAPPSVRKVSAGSLGH